MNFKIEDIVRNLTAYLGIIYVLGFIIFNTYLFKYGITEINILNIDYLKSGFIYSIFVSIFLIPYFEFVLKKKNIDEFYIEKLLFKRLFGFFIILWYLISILELIAPTINIIYLFVPFVYMSLYKFFHRYITKNQVPQRIKNFNYILSNIYLLLYFIYRNDEFGYGILLSAGCILAAFELFILPYPFDSIKHATIFLTILSSVMLFGYDVYKDLPSFFTGINHSQKKLIYKEEHEKFIKELGLVDSSKFQTTIPLQILFENNNTYYLGNDDTLRWKLNKDIFLGEIEIDLQKSFKKPHFF